MIKSNYLMKGLITANHVIVSSSRLYTLSAIFPDAHHPAIYGRYLVKSLYSVCSATPSIA